jgi:hypothetical protein
VPTVQTIRRLPPSRNSDLPKPMLHWELETQQAHPLRLVDASAGDVAEITPPAGLNQTTGQTNQNQEITYVLKTAGKFTLSGNQADGTNNLPLGPYTIAGEGSVLKIKSDGTNWWKSA